MIGDLLDATRIEVGPLELQLEQVDIREVVNDVVELYRNQGTAHEIEVTLPAHPLFIVGDRLRLEEVLTNLVSNAIKYSPNGAPVDIEARQAGAEIIIGVVDRGIGMSDAELPHIFEPFRRVGLSRSTVPGVGLGLSVARRVVEEHGGRLHVTSRLGLGSTFIVSLPVERSFGSETG